jgi:hypothetical protein
MIVESYMYNKAVTLIIIMLLINLFVCPFSFAREVILENGTRVRLKLVDKISSKLNNEGDEVNFLVTDDIKLVDTVLIKEGTRATGIISELIPRGKIGKAGRLVVNLDSTKAVNGKRISLTGEIRRKGEDKMIFSIVISVFLSPICLLLRGTDAQLPAGYKYNARVDRDVILDLPEEDFDFDKL